MQFLKSVVKNLIFHLWNLNFSFSQNETVKNIFNCGIYLHNIHIICILRISKFHRQNLKSEYLYLQVNMRTNCYSWPLVKQRKMFYVNDQFFIKKKKSKSEVTCNRPKIFSILCSLNLNLRMRFAAFVKKSHTLQGWNVPKSKHT